MPRRLRITSDSSPGGLGYSLLRRLLDPQGIRIGKDCTYEVVTCRESVSPLREGDVCLSLGQAPTWGLVGYRNLMKARGFIWRREGAVVVPSFSLEFIGQADTWQAVFRADVARWMRLWAEPGSTLDDEGAHLVGGLEVLEDLGPSVSLDIETDGIEPLLCNLLCVGISDGTRTGVIWPWRPEYILPLSVWLGVREAVVTHNGHNFDLIVLEAHGVVW